MRSIQFPITKHVAEFSRRFVVGALARVSPPATEQRKARRQT